MKLSIRRYCLLGMFVCLSLCMGCSEVVKVDKLSMKEALLLAKDLPGVLDKVLQKYVDKDGLVDYKALRKDPSGIDTYIDVMGKVSPRTHPKLFVTKQDKLAYWLNAYNATILKNALRFPKWTHLDSKARRASFFALSKFIYGGQKMSPHVLEQELLRKVFKEPRIHFALNCASLGCPKLPRKAFRGKTLDAELTRETKAFLLETRNVRIDEEERVIHLTSLFKWYRSDFTDHLKVRKLTSEAFDAIITYINMYRPKTKQLPEEGFTIQFIKYDWRLNDQAGPKRKTQPSTRRSRSR